MTTQPTRVVLAGLTGRMGTQLAELIHESADLTLVGGTSRARPDLGELLPKSDVVIDFTSAEASVQHARLCAQAKVPLIVGSTGIEAHQQLALEQAAREIALVCAPNMSVGVNLVINLAAQLARHLGPDFDIEVVETHHRQKKDAPSGTALKLAKELAHATGRTEQALRSGREGHVGARPRGEIGLHAVRGGDVVGEHTVFFLGEGERVELTHRATSRDQFARGALRAARWVRTQPAGLYDMSHVLGTR